MRPALPYAGSGTRARALDTGLMWRFIQAKNVLAAAAAAIAICGCSAPHLSDTTSAEALFARVRNGTPRSRIHELYGNPPLMHMQYSAIGVLLFSNGQLSGYYIGQNTKVNTLTDRDPVRVGMTPDEVRGILGAPTSICESYTTGNYRIDTFCYSGDRVNSKSTDVGPMP